MTWCDIRFSSAKEANNVAVGMVKTSNKNGYVTLQDYADLAGINPPDYDQFFGTKWHDIGWIGLQLTDICVRPDLKSTDYRLVFRQLPQIFGTCRAPAHEVIKKLKNYMNKEETTMPSSYVNYNVVDAHTIAFGTGPKDETALKYEQEIRELREAAEKQIQEIRDALAEKLDRFNKERREQEFKDAEAEKARYWKRRYDSLVEAGFSEDQAWEITKESFRED